MSEGWASVKNHDCGFGSTTLSRMVPASTGIFERVCHSEVVAARPLDAVPRIAAAGRGFWASTWRAPAWAPAGVDWASKDFSSIFDPLIPPASLIDFTAAVTPA